MPYRFPSGRDLTVGIKVLTASGSTIYQALRPSFSDKHILDFRQELHQSGRQSVDAFLEHRPEFLDVGKAAVSAYLLPLERTDVLFSDDLADTWYWYLMERIAPSPEAFQSNRTNVVTFNYDRSVEQYVLCALQARFGLSTDHAHAEMTSHFRVAHVYGSLGRLPVHGEYGEGVMRYDVQPSPGNILAAARDIRIVGERTNDNEGLREAWALLKEAQRIIFLGFAYDATNVARLMEYGPGDDQSIYGCAYGLTNGERSLAWQAIVRTGYPRAGANEMLDNTNGKILPYLRHHCWLG